MISFLCANEAAILRRVRARVGRAGLRARFWRLREGRSTRKVMIVYAVARSVPHGRSFYVHSAREMLAHAPGGAVDWLALTLAEAAITFLRDPPPFLGAIR